MNSKLLNTNTKFRLFLLLFVTCFSLSSKAQFFSFQFPGERQQQQVKREKMTPPEYKGGKEGINKYLEKTFQNPEERKNIEGNIIVACIVSPKGKVEDAQLVKSVDKELNQEAIRVAKTMKFKPAMIGKKKARGRIDITFPIRHGRLSFITLNTVDV